MTVWISKRRRLPKALTWVIARLGGRRRETLAEVVANLLEREHFEVTVCLSGADALDVAAGGRPGCGGARPQPAGIPVTAYEGVDCELAG
jgi:hypothetical protein